ncbi:hypothetical protein [Propionicimonas sp.]|uniref:hypothetical protein n=1 Tax=Propionicimonas sp. TaxID=1955623 RepID=UPI001849C735|nr:hypothetical protein [Propionicimonas sp.]MBU3977803.1 hypothetical protein [Actinomycetota bacterium]MBA3021726.1 hypothetical protein [Propionicimonas sp.]MBU3987277.1 hypothetical protein [Actinomycetota bacterium]MBU4009098.1 hypothetical protein [Actinomycetota bacterium]MBU4065752.1 hypothetical protein [Actinomycetota bacterium]
MRTEIKHHVLQISAALPLGLLLTGIAAGPALGVDGVIVEETTVTATQDGGTITAEVRLTNLGPQRMTLPASQEVKEGCSASVRNRDLELLQTTTASIQFDGSCFSEESPILQVDLDGDQRPIPAITVRSPTGPSDWAPAETGMWWGIALAVVVLSVGILAKWQADHTMRKSEDARKSAYADVQTVVNARMVAAGGDALQWRPQLPVLKYPWFSGSVGNLEAGWSLGASFVSNLTLGSTAVVALVTSVDAATAILGGEPKAAFRVMAVIGLVSAVLIAIANLIVKVLGSKASEVTPIGLIVATAIVVGAATLQTVTVGASAARLVAPPAEIVASPLTPAEWFAWAATALFAVALGLYGLTAVWRWIVGGAPTNVPPIPADALAAWSGRAKWQQEIVKQDLQKAFKPWLETDKRREPREAEEEREASETHESAERKSQAAEDERQTRTAAQRLRLAGGEELQSALL